MSILDATQHLLPHVPLSDDDLLDIEDILDASAAWQAGELPWTEAARLGGIERNGTPSEAYSRFCAVRCTPRDDPRRSCLIALCGHIDTMLGGVQTRHGRFTARQMDEMEQHNQFLFANGIVWEGIR